MRAETRAFGEAVLALVRPSFSNRQASLELLGLCRSYEVALLRQSERDIEHWKAHAERIEESARRSIAQILTAQAQTATATPAPGSPTAAPPDPRA